MTAVYTWDVFSTLDGYGSYDPEVADWGGYWSKQGPELLEHRAALFATEQRLVFGATTFREMAQIHRQRRRRRHRQPPKRGLGRAAAFPGWQPVAEPRVDGGRPGRPPAGDNFPGHLRTDRDQPDPRRRR
jgi:hypothetical protein